MSNLISSNCTFGADPELFISRVGRTGKRVTTGSEMVVPPTGLRYIKDGMASTVVRDGVQAEFHPHPSSCRQTFAGGIMSCFTALTMEMKKHPELEIDLSQVVRVTKKELDKLSPSSRILGCHPSRSAYGLAPISTDGKVIRTRSASGHIHLGGPVVKDNITPERYNQLAKIMDLTVGIPCVLIDRNPDAAVRRKLYGRAGEYRVQPHGFEYRTLSNFWLRSPVLLSLVSGLSRNAASLLYNKDMVEGTYGFSDIEHGAEDLLAVDSGPIVQAINTNDFDLARSIYDRHVRPIFARMRVYSGVDTVNVQAFDHFVAKGLDHWFPKDTTSVLASWQSNDGWENFADYKVVPDMRRAA